MSPAYQNNHRLHVNSNVFDDVHSGNHYDGNNDGDSEDERNRAIHNLREITLSFSEIPTEFKNTYEIDPRHHKSARILISVQWEKK